MGRVIRPVVQISERDPNSAHALPEFLTLRETTGVAKPLFLDESGMEILTRFPV